MFKETGLMYAGPDFLDIFSFEMVSGDRETALDDPNSMVITESTALKYFGSENPIGRTLSYDGAFDFVVTGVVKDVPYNSHFTFDFLLPIESYNAIAGYEYAYDASSYRITDQWTAGMFRTYIKLAEDTSPADLEAKLPDFLLQYSQFNRELLDQRLYLQPIQDIHLFSQYTASKNNISDIGLIYALSAMGMLILIMACFNYMNMSTAGYSTRAREVGMRKVVGAHRSQLVKQFFGESIVFSVVSLFISMIVVAVVLPFYNDITGKTVSFFGSAGIFTDLTLFGGLIGIVFFSALIAGSYPAIFLSGFRPVSVLNNQSGETGKSFKLRNVLIVFQYGISIFLLVCSGLIYNQVNYMKNKDMGYVKEQIVILPVKDDVIRQQSESIKNELVQYTGITDVSFSSVTPTSIVQSTTVDIIINDRRTVFELSFGYVDHSFADLYELEFTQGRNYSPDFPSDAGSSAIINETAASMLGWDSPLGQQMPNFGGRTVIGVVKDFHYQSLQLPVGPLILLPGDQNKVVASVKISTENIPSTLDMLETTWKKFSPDRPFEYTFFDTQFEQLYRAEETIGRTAGYFTLLAIFIASLGLFGLALFTVEQKTREIGIRKVLGATVPGIVNLLAKDFLKLVAVANIAAWPIAYLVMDKWLQGFAFHIDIGIGVFVLSALLALGIALLTVSFQAVKAALSNPVDSLRYE